MFVTSYFPFAGIDKNNNGSLEQSELDQFVDQTLNFIANHKLAAEQGTTRDCGIGVQETFFLFFSV
jgi:hypothetical protein